MDRRRSKAWWMVNAAAYLLAAVALFPLLWMVCAAVKSPQAILDSPLPNSWPRWNSFNYLFAHARFIDWLINSLFLASMQTLSTLLLTSAAGFALAKYRFPGRRALEAILIVSLLLPPQLLLPGTYELIARLGMMNTYAALLLPGTLNVLAIFLFRQAMKQIPDSLLHAARIDGCGELRIWWEIVLPTIRPTTAAVTLFSFLGSWNGYLWPQIVLQDASKFTLPLGLGNLLGSFVTYEQLGALMAGTLLSLLPVFVVFFLVEREFVSGMTSGAEL